MALVLRLVDAAGNQIKGDSSIQSSTWGLVRSRAMRPSRFSRPATVTPFQIRSRGEAGRDSPATDPTYSSELAAFWCRQVAPLP
jgi:hypothetical protein